MSAAAGPALQAERPVGGMQLLARCETDDAALCARLRAEGVMARPLSEMLYHASSERGLFLGFSAWTEAEIGQGVAALARALRR